MIINLDELKEEKKRLSREYGLIELYEAKQMTFYQCKMQEYKEKLYSCYNDEFLATHLFYKGLYEHHAMLRLEAKEKHDLYLYQSKNLTEDDISEDDTVPF